MDFLYASNPSVQDVAAGVAMAGLGMVAGLVALALLIYGPELPQRRAAERSRRMGGMLLLVAGGAAFAGQATSGGTALGLLLGHSLGLGIPSVWILLALAAGLGLLRMTSQVTGSIRQSTWVRPERRPRVPDARK